MFREMHKSKIHRAVVTEANLNYVGSITIDQDILDASNILENEKVQVVNINNGARLETYVITGPKGSGMVCLNGAAARLVQPGDRVIIISYAMMEESVPVSVARGKVIEGEGDEQNINIGGSEEIVTHLDMVS